MAISFDVAIVKKQNKKPSLGYEIASACRCATQGGISGRNKDWVLICASMDDIYQSLQVFLLTHT